MGWYTSLALDAAGRPHIIYPGEHGLMYTRYDGSAWHVEMVALRENRCAEGSLALDASGQPPISFSNTKEDVLKYAYPAAEGVVARRLVVIAAALVGTLLLTGLGLAWLWRWAFRRPVEV